MESDIKIDEKNFNELLKSEVFKALCSFLEILPEKMFCNLSRNDIGEYVFRFKIYAKSIKTVGFLRGGEM